MLRDPYFFFFFLFLCKRYNQRLLNLANRETDGGVESVEKERKLDFFNENKKRKKISSAKKIKNVMKQSEKTKEKL